MKNMKINDASLTISRTVFHSISIKKGSFLEAGADAVAHGCNCKGVMGAGAAKAIRAKFPEVFPEYKQKCRAGSFRPQDVMVVDTSDGRVAFNMATQDAYGRTGVHASVNNIKECLIKVREEMEARGLRSLALPPIGCALGGLSKDDVYPAIDEVFKNSDIVATIWEFDKTEHTTGNKTKNINQEELLKNVKITRVPSNASKTGNVCAFWQGPLSQWARSEFIVKDIQFVNCEQFMMYCKAKLFEDEEIAKAIMVSTNPSDIKDLGRKVRGFNEKVWNEKCKGYVYQGNLAKFSQNPDLLQVLLMTGDDLLVESSPYDKIWGVGLKTEDPRMSDYKQWPGSNWLGLVLTKVRNVLRTENNKK